MSLGTWEPEATQPSYQIQADTLNMLINLAKDEVLATLQQHISNEDILKHQPIMTLSLDDWKGATTTLSNDDIIALIKVFTVAEMELSGWEAGAKSPVIWLTKVLKQRKAPLDKPLLLWIKSHTTNRFLPNGAL